MHPHATVCRAASALALLAAVLPFPAGAAEKSRPRGGSVGPKITSGAFPAGGEVPTTYTCEGRDISPPLAWSELPPGTAALALIVDDPDAPDPAAPKATWVHWVLYDLPPTAAGLPEGATGKAVPEGTKEGLNDWKRTGYGGPCPPAGRHRYFFKLYALSAPLPDLGRPDKAKLERAMEGKILGKGELVGTYQKKGGR